MRFYDITAGGKHYSSAGNPTALNIECDINIIDADTFAGSTIVIWGTSLEDLKTDLSNQPFKMSGGMQHGLPLANAQAGEAGILIKGHVFACYGNWIGTEMTLNLVVYPGEPEPTPPPPNAPNPPPKNIILNWKKGSPMGDAVKQALQTAYPGMKPNVNISSKLVAPQNNPGYYGNLAELGRYLREVSQQIMTGDQKYPGVGCCMQKGEITVHDGTSSPSGGQIKFTDLIGQPTWFEPGIITIKVVMRGDLEVGQTITLPPTPVITTTAAQSGLPGPLTFQGKFTIRSLRHVGNFRQPDGSAWITVIEATKD